MSERNPIPACLSHLEQMLPKATSPTAMGFLIQDLRTYAKALADQTAGRLDMQDAAETMTRAADHLEALRQTPPERQAIDAGIRSIDEAIAGLDAMMKAFEPGPRKLCRDCKWCGDQNQAGTKCLHDLAKKPERNIVTGDLVGAPVWCVNMRLAMGAPCGIEARLFEVRLFEVRETAVAPAV